MHVGKERNMRSDEEAVITKVMQTLADELGEHPDIQKRDMIMSLVISLLMTLIHNENLNNKGRKKLIKIVGRITKKAMKDMERNPDSVGVALIRNKKHYEN